MDDPTGDVRAGAPRVPRVRRNRKQEQEHVRDVLVALGGSPEKLDPANDGSATETSIGSRVAAYSRFGSSSAAAASIAPVAVTSSPVVETKRPLEPVRRPARPERIRRRRPPVARHVRHAALALAHVAGTLVHGLLRAVIALARALGGAVLAVLRAPARAARLLASIVVRVARFFARLVLHTARLLRVVVRRATDALKRSAHSAFDALRTLGHVVLHVVLLPRSAVRRLGRARRHSKAARLRQRRDGHGDDTVAPARVAEAVLTWVQAPAPSRPSAEPAGDALEDGTSSARPEPVTPPVEVEPEVRGVLVPAAEPPAKDRTRQRRRKARLGLTAVAVAAAVVAGGALLFTRHDAGSAAPQSSDVAAGQPVPTRRDFSNAREYGAAMTRMALTSGRTQVDGQVACNQDSTWDSWTCQARGKPSLGAYAGVWLTYRCSPNSTPQPGGRPAAVMINCAPVNPPPPPSA